MVSSNGRFDVKGNAFCQAGSTLTLKDKILFESQIFSLHIQISLLQALLSGCSAGGLATIIHCDEFRGLFPWTAKVKCLSDAGLFLDV